MTEPVVNAAADQTKKFDGILSSWIGVTKKGMAMARALAELSLIHFRDHGNTALCQKFLDAIEAHGKNYVRASAYKLWLKEHSPITMVEGKFKKLDGGVFDEEKIAAALKTPFWDFAPEPADILWAETDIVKALQSVVKKFKGDRYKPADAAAVARLAEVETLVTSLGAEKVAA